MTVRRLLVAGLASMGAALLASAIWPAVATAISVMLVALVLVSVGVGVLLAARVLRARLVARRSERSHLAPAAVVATEPGRPTSTLADLSESA